MARKRPDNCTNIFFKFNCILLTIDRIVKFSNRIVGVNPLEAYKTEFIEFMVRAGVLKFGEFVTKSGRKTPFFINTGNYATGQQLNSLGYYYASALVKELGQGDFHLYGPAYKGIPLVVACSMQLDSNFQRDYTFTFNRKEVKDHGEGGSLVGYSFKDNDRVVLIEDVTTSGASVHESVPVIMSQAAVKIEALIVSVDRMEKGQGSQSALKELEAQYGLKAISIVNLLEVIDHLRGREIDGKVVLTEDLYLKILEYRKKYGV